MFRTARWRWPFYSIPTAAFDSRQFQFGLKLNFLLTDSNAHQITSRLSAAVIIQFPTIKAVVAGSLFSLQRLLAARNHHRHNTFLLKPCPPNHRSAQSRRSAFRKNSELSKILVGPPLCLPRWRNWPVAIGRGGDTYLSKRCPENRIGLRQRNRRTVEMCRSPRHF